MKRMLCFSISLVVSLAVNGFSDTIHVPSGQPTIQDGINAAVHGDVVLVAPGTYVENIDFIGKAISVKSSHGADRTTIDGGSFVGLPNTMPVGLFIGSGLLQTPIQHTWGLFHLQAPWFLAPLITIPSNGVLVLEDTIPGHPKPPYDVFLQSLVGDVLTNPFTLEIR